MPTIERKLALVTGGCGGMGLACARAFGPTHDLILTDISAEKLEKAQAMLADEGFIVRGTVAGDLASGQTLDAISDVVGVDTLIDRLIHTAGVSSGMTDWQTITKTNVLGSQRLLDRLDPHVGAGTVGILVASVAGHLAPRDAEIDALYANPEAPDFLDRVEQVLKRISESPGDVSFNYSSLSGPAYGLSKRFTIRLAASRGLVWAGRGARLLSISPGIIYTPMGRFEVDHGEAAAEVLAGTPLKRWGTPADIAQAALFLCSDLASFITATDLRVDGGMVPMRVGGNNW